jgi:hypothetical protein
LRKLITSTQFSNKNKNDFNNGNETMIRDVSSSLLTELESIIGEFEQQSNGQDNSSYQPELDPTNDHTQNTTENG